MPVIAVPGPGTTGGRRMMLMVRACDPVPVGLVAVTFTLNAPATVGIPAIRPVAGLIDSPVGRPVAPKLVGLLVAVSWWTNELPVPPEACAAPVNTGGRRLSVIVSACVAVAVGLVALSTTLKAPLTVGVPAMRPVVGLTVSPGGSPVAPKLVGLLVAVIW